LGVPFSLAEKRRAKELYCEFESLRIASQLLGRSPSGVYNVLNHVHCIKSNRKANATIKDEIIRSYFRECRSRSEISRSLGVSRTTVSYWLRKSGHPISKKLLDIAGGRAVNMSAGSIDLLPFAELCHLRWVDDSEIRLKTTNSHVVILPRTTDALKFAYVVGFYLAEGNKGKGPSGLRNTNTELVREYLAATKSMFQSDFRIYDFHAIGKRSAQRDVRFGGECMKRVFLNAIDGILDATSGKDGSVSAEIKDLGTSFLRGCANGDGTVSKSKQAKAQKKRFRFFLTEGSRHHAERLTLTFKEILGVGHMYKPRRRNYYLVICSLSPEKASYLLKNDFFSFRHDMRARLAEKARDSKYISQVVRIYSEYGTSIFSLADVTGLTGRIRADFIGRAVGRGDLIPGGTQATGTSAGPHWFRQYRIAPKAKELAERILISSQTCPWEHVHGFQQS
jgi:transcriptional regulator with XRE-family HTH domain